MGSIRMWLLWVMVLPLFGLCHVHGQLYCSSYTFSPGAGVGTFSNMKYGDDRKFGINCGDSGIATLKSIRARSRYGMFRLYTSNDPGYPTPDNFFYYLFASALTDVNCFGMRDLWQTSTVIGTATIIYVHIQCVSVNGCQIDWDVQAGDCVASGTRPSLKRNSS